MEKLAFYFCCLIISFIVADVYLLGMSLLLNDGKMLASNVRSMLMNVFLLRFLYWDIFLDIKAELDKKYQRRE